MSAPGHDVAAELRTAGLTATAQRRIVLGAVEGRERPASAIEVHDQLRRDGHRVGLTTVYRTLHALAGVGLVHAFHRNGEDTYRHCRYGPHHHLICQTCGLVIERPASEMDTLMEQIRAEADFLPDPQQADLVGVCVTCHISARYHQRTQS
ncbi:MAG TPA: Fur family transcriptional regulator [Streptosporangiaceae bacterium]|jgi:Fur family ferric uptake transcriptional regulator|nr:Fur family transcriptional regulator [Streptosporangiaceae bacterium]